MAVLVLSGAESGLRRHLHLLRQQVLAHFSARTDRRSDVNTIKTVVTESFKFDALPIDVCPYTAGRCVPMPGIRFVERP